LFNFTLQLLFETLFGPVNTVLCASSAMLRIQMQLKKPGQLTSVVTLICILEGNSAVPQSIQFGDEANFHLNSYMNKQYVCMGQ
jgi:hypothetical protein